jgi:hypothetical protein
MYKKHSEGKFIAELYTLDLTDLLTSSSAMLKKLSCYSFVIFDQKIMEESPKALTYSRARYQKLTLPSAPHQSLNTKICRQMSGLLEKVYVHIKLGSL